jgi:hypothetical protein
MSQTESLSDDRLLFKCSAMVLFALEQSLGSYVREKVSELDDLPGELPKRLLELPNKIDTVEVLIQETYVGEMLDLAVKAASLASDQEPLRALKKLADGLELYDIRNAIAHPNRPFPACYWYRLAAIATDPSISVLGFNAVRHAFDSAIAGVIELPPEDWFPKSAFQIPNNLPQSLEHEITGLIGRQKEKKDLAKALRLRRLGLIALVGLGGTGKTAIALDLLRDASLDPRTCDWADEILFVTGKTEQLTRTGPVPIDNPITSIDAVKTALVSELVASNELEGVDSLEAVAEKLAARKVFICLDNLETLLRDHPAPFDDFLDALPENWRLLVTSRIPVESARNISIGRMQPEAAGALARKYLQLRGGHRLEEQAVEQLVDRTDRNPLAIRVCVDSLVAGLDLSTALAQTRDNILEFSYTNLIRHLPPVANQILECLFAANQILARHQVRSLLSNNIDQIAIGLQALSRTSLITRHADESIEFYGLSSSIRDLLLRHPLDDDTRTAVFERLAEQRSTLEHVRSLAGQDPLDRSYISPECPMEIVHDVFRAFQMIRKREAKAVMADQLDRLRSECITQAEPAIFRAIAALLLELNDRDSARQMLEQALERDIIDSSARLMLAELYRDEKRLDECCEISNPLRNEGWFAPGKTERANLGRVAKVTWLVGIWRGKAIEEIPHLRGWNQEPLTRAIKGCMYATALRRLLENEANEGRLNSYIDEMVTCLSQIFQVDGYIGFVVSESAKAIREITRKAKAVALKKDVIRSIVAFANLHLEPICQIGSHLTSSDARIQDFIQVINEQARAVGETEICQAYPDFVDNSVLSDYGFIPVKVYAPATDRDGLPRSFLFAEDAEGVQYHVSKRVFSKPEVFTELKTGDPLLVLPRDEIDEGRAIPVNEALLPSE